MDGPFDPPWAGGEAYDTVTEARRGSDGGSFFKRGLAGECDGRVESARRISADRLNADRQIRVFQPAPTAPCSVPAATLRLFPRPVKGDICSPRPMFGRTRPHHALPADDIVRQPLRADAPGAFQECCARDS